MVGKVKIPDPWLASESDFPETGSPSEKWLFLLNFAVRAPSLYNSQPWLFQVCADEVELYVDRSRSIPVADPDQRALYASCGTMVSFLQAAVSCFGLESTVSTFPEIGKADLIARLQLKQGSRPVADRSQLLSAFENPCDCPLAFESHLEVPLGIRQKIREKALDHDAGIRWFTRDEERQVIAGLVAQSTRVSLGKREYTDEMIQWVRSKDDPRQDGMTEIAPHLSALLELTTSGTSIPPEIESVFPGLARHADFLVVGLKRGNPVSWFTSGRVLGDILLDLSAAGYCSLSLNQPIQVNETRQKLAEMTEFAAPQFLISVGRSPKHNNRPRRPVHTMLYNPYRLGPVGV